MQTFLKQKFVRISVVAVTVVLLIFGLAMMGSVLGAKPKALPVALVTLDNPADLPTGGQLALGEMVKQKLTGNDQIPVKWKVTASVEEAVALMDRQEAYGAIVLPSDLSAGVLSMQTGKPQPATVKLYVNEGMSAQGVAAAKTIMQQVSRNVGAELSQQIFGQLGERMETIPVGVAKSLMTPFQTEEVIMHAVGANNAGGGAPNMLTQIIWMSSLVSGVLLFLAGKFAGRGKRSLAIAAGQTVVGLALAAGASGLLVWMASSWYGMELADPTAVWLFLWLAASAFFLLQSTLLNWIGMPAIAILVLLLFFSLPVLNIAPEFMPQATHDWLYSWTPFRYVAAGLRDQMYFDGASGMGLTYGVLWGIIGVGLIALLASGLRGSSAKAPAGAAAELAGAGSGADGSVR